MNQIIQSASSIEVLRHISEELLIRKVRESGLLLLDGEFKEEYETELYDLFLKYGDDSEIYDWDKFAKQILHNGTPEAREELKHISFEFVEDYFLSFSDED